MLPRRRRPMTPEDLPGCALSWCSGSKIPEQNGRVLWLAMNFCFSSLPFSFFFSFALLQSQGDVCGVAPFSVAGFLRPYEPPGFRVGRNGAARKNSMRWGNIYSFTLCRVIGCQMLGGDNQVQLSCTYLTFLHNIRFSAPVQSLSSREVIMIDYLLEYAPINGPIQSFVAPYYNIVTLPSRRLVSEEACLLF
jgi:hypothetical protein